MTTIAELLPTAQPATVDRPVFGGVDTFGGALLAQVDPDMVAEVVADAVELARPWLCDAAGRWTADYVRLRFSAHRPDGLA